MIIRGLDSDGDWTFGAGKSNYKRELDAIKQNIATKYNEWVGDCFFDQQAGIDWNTRLDYNQTALLEQDIKKLIAGCSGVTNIITLNFSLVERVFKATYEVATIYSQNIAGELTNA